ncbi:MAG: hypothetical protein IJR47_01800, partial [Clostridia bacterium]|nr:hypothetical protein [Clostridia bacterium]
MSEVYRLYVHKREQYAEATKGIFNDIVSSLQINSIEKLLIINRYDVQGVDKNTLERSKNTIFSEPSVDNIFEDFDFGEFDHCFAVEFLPGQYD